MVHLSPKVGEKSPTGTLSSPPRSPRQPSEGAYFYLACPIFSPTFGERREKNLSNSSTTVSGNSSRFDFCNKACPAPSIGTSFVGAGISLIALANSSIEPKGSRTPLTNRRGARRLEKCAVRNCVGRPGGGSGYDSRSRPSP